MSTHMETERRREPRVRAANLVHIEELGDWQVDHDSIARTVDLSRGGLRIELDHAPQLSAIVHLELALGETLLPLQGRVCSVNERRGEGERGDTDATARGACWEAGVELCGVTQEQHEALDTYLRRRADSAPGAAGPAGRP